MNLKSRFISILMKRGCIERFGCTIDNTSKFDKAINCMIAYISDFEPTAMGILPYILFIRCLQFR